MLLGDEERFHMSAIPWPVPPPDLTVPDLFPWELKKCVHRNRSHTKHWLKPIIRDECATINRQLLRRVFDNFVNR